VPQHAHSDCDACGWSVKDVPERFVKDVMELDTFSAAYTAERNLGFSPGGRL
jgi:hypothetical protein